jgi:hypothetical protein
LTKLLKSTPERQVRLGGHVLRADMPWLIHLGVDAREEFRVADTPELTKTHGGWDTATMIHSCIETMEGGYKLENMAARFCGVPRYDVKLQAWKDRYCKDRQLKDRELEGYGMCDDHILHPYALYDVDSTFRLFERFNGVGAQVGMLDCDSVGLSSRAAFWLSHGATLAALEMEMTGILLDRERGDTLTQLFIAARTARLAELRSILNWPDFNPGSAFQVRDWLYGEALNGAKRQDEAVPVRLRPAHLESLDFTPVKAAGAKLKLTWEQVVARNLVGLVNPAADKESTGIFSYDRTPTTILDPDGKPYTKGDLVGRLRDIKFIGQVLSGVLRRPLEMGGQLILDDDDNVVYDGGLLYWMGEDGRVRTHFGLAETGRWTSWLPALQNISKRRESDYVRILGSKDPAHKYYRHDATYCYPIRSMLRARPGCVLVEADYKMAEMAAIGWLAQDPAMMEMVRRNSLPESHPDFVDPHSLTAVRAFKLDMPANHAALATYNAKKGTDIAWAATKEVLEAIGCLSLRVAAKNVIFGTPYGRSAEAIARQCGEEGADVSVAEAQLLIDAYYETYPQIKLFLDQCKAAVHDPGYMEGTFGRRRRFPATDDEKLLADMERAAMNFKIQNAVADTIDIACANMYDYRAELHAAGETRTFSMCLQIHDALLFEVPISDVAWFLDDVLPQGMRDWVDIWPRGWDGHVLPGVTEPYHLDIDCSVELYWGEKLNRDWGLSVGLPEVTPGGRRILPKAKKAT